jgi:hypothetical protein
MSRYLLSTYRVEGEVSGTRENPRDLKAFMERVMAVEDDMESEGAFVFGGALGGPESAAVARVGEPIITDGPFAEAKEQIAGFYIIEADHEADAHSWARRVAEAVNHPIEVRPFMATGRVRDQIPEAAD